VSAERPYIREAHRLIIGDLSLHLQVPLGKPGASRRSAAWR
jgi:hypothetical protein